MTLEVQKLSPVKFYDFLITFFGNPTNPNEAQFKLNDINKEHFGLTLIQNNSTDQIKVGVQILSPSPPPSGDNIDWDNKETYGGEYPSLIVNFRLFGASDRQFYRQVKKLK